MKGSQVLRSVVLVTALAATAGCATVSRPIYGVQEGRLAFCDGIPGCVNSQAAPGAHSITPLTFESARNDARSDLLMVLRSLGNNRVVSSHRSYMRSEFTIGDRIDDVEFYLPLDTRVIHIRSVTRQGMPDSGENRVRVEEIRIRFNELQERR